MVSNSVRLALDRIDTHAYFLMVFPISLSPLSLLSVPSAFAALYQPAAAEQATTPLEKAAQQKEEKQKKTDAKMKKNERVRLGLGHSCTNSRQRSSLAAS